MYGKIKQLFMISCALVPLFFNGHAFYFLFLCQAHVHGLHRPFVDKNSRNTPGSQLFLSKMNETPPGFQLFFSKL